MPLKGFGRVERPDYSELLSGVETDKYLPKEQQMPEAPVAMQLGQALSTDQGVYLMGGDIGVGTVVIDNVFLFSFNEWRWAEEDYTLPQTLYGAAHVSISDLNILTGGHDGGSTYNDTTWEVDPDSGTFTSVATQPTCHWQPWMTSNYNDTIYVGGGWDQDSGTVVTSVLEYDINNQSWTNIGDMDTALYGSGATYDPNNGLIYVWNGFNSSNTGTTDLRSYDPDTDTWTSGLANLDNLSVTPCAGMIDGYPTSLGSDELYNSRRYNPSSGSLVPINQQLPEMGYVCKTIHDGVLYFVGGHLFQEQVVQPSVAAKFEPER